MLDILVAGAGPSGTATAIAAASRGFSVRLVDPKDGVIDKACGEGLMPTAVNLLEGLGVDIPTSHPFRGIRYVRGTQHADGTFPQGPGLGVRRTVLHAALGRRADELGVDRVKGRLDQIEQHGDHIRSGSHKARWLIAADGLRSPIRHQLGLDMPATWQPRYGIRQHYKMSPWSDFVEVYWADDAEAYVTPVSDELVGIAFLFGDAARRRISGDPGRPFDRMLASFPTLRDRLSSPATKPRGAGPFSVRSARRVSGRVMLVGDAAGYLDPLTGEGIKLGVSAGVAAVDAIAQGAPGAYEASWRRLYRPYHWSTGGLLSISRIPLVRRCMVPFLQRTPWLFNRILGHLVG